MVFLEQASCFSQDAIESLTEIRKEMKTFIVLCVTICLEGSSKGMSICHTFGYTFKST